jgi:hypothetical protein
MMGNTLEAQAKMFHKRATGKDFVPKEDEKKPATSA